jgi:hypothetical protein
VAESESENSHPEPHHYLDFRNPFLHGLGGEENAKYGTCRTPRERRRMDAYRTPMLLDYFTHHPQSETVAIVFCDKEWLEENSGIG